ncbi:hypothetical protein INS49_006210 [Diaporthe citri]|uniref:uncharacterized protein n=1 Tax=Diaporthe citri TaxID=83186 RepID=UPI001C81026C|nr:uncharacterized protein INS49_006210 [Diaporthe citri]KAG6364608.1 hypothetical protein INS49_006210 [Diaporthe citri]
MLASTGCLLFLRATSNKARRASQFYLIQHELPVLRKRISLGGATLSVWLVGLILATTGFWAQPLLEYWAIRTVPLDWTTAKIRLAVTGIIGHHADLLLGLVIIPVSRNSLLGQAFELHQSTLLYAHKLIAYLLFAAALAHGAAYYFFVGAYRPALPERKMAFNIDNPTQTIEEAEQGSGWYYATLPAGMIGFLLMVTIIITSLPALRRKSYNTFYYVHVICSFWAFVALSVHASTDFYFLLPGLILWIADWCWRFFRGTSGGLGKKVVGTIENAGEGWYRISLPASAKSIDEPGAAEKEAAITHPVQSYNLVLPEISKTQNHAFTVAKVGSVAEGPVFLLQRAQGKVTKKLEKEWTWKLGAVVAEVGSRREVEMRVEGPYYPSDVGFAVASRVICIVGGTGLTGAYSLAMWWLKHRSQDQQAEFQLVWTVRYNNMTNLREWKQLGDTVTSVPNMAIRVHVSSESGRMDTEGYLRDMLSTGSRSTTIPDMRHKAWVYVSGPESLLSSTEMACLATRRKVRNGRRQQDSHPWLVADLEWFSAKWEV